jgi:ditrans,polycis-polyprenyl diphosphate synthase
MYAAPLQETGMVHNQNGFITLTPIKAQLQETDMVHRKGVKVRVIGDLELLPLSVMQAARKAMDASKDNDKAVLNICLAYTSRQEIISAVNSAAR